MSALRFVAVLLAIAFSTPSFGQSLALTMSKSFSPSSVQVGGTSTTTMTVTVTNPNSFTVTGITFSDTYPAGLVPDVIGAYTCSAGIASFSGSGWAFSGTTLGPGSSCTVPILMHATTVGGITNTTSSVTGTGIPTGGAASATLNVTAAPVPNVPVPALSLQVLLALATMLSLLGATRLRA